MWSRGNHKLFKVNGLNVSSTSEDSGMTRIQLLKNSNIATTLPDYLNVLDIVTNQVKVPNDETTYWCHVFKLSQEFDKKHHIYQVIKIIILILGGRVFI